MISLIPTFDECTVKFVIGKVKETGKLVSEILEDERLVVKLAKEINREWFGNLESQVAIEERLYIVLYVLGETL